MTNIFINHFSISNTLFRGKSFNDEAMSTNSVTNEPNLEIKGMNCREYSSNLMYGTLSEC